MNSISANLNIMIKACEKASKTLIRDFGEVEKLQVSIKGPLDFVSNADTKAEKIIINELTKSRKNYSIISEEDGSKINEDKDNVWIIDPIDGTTNFLHGVPHFAISIALKSKNEIVSGLIYDPIKDENDYYFINQKSFDQINIKKKIIGEKGKFLSENLEITINFYNEKPLSIELPKQIECKINSTDVALKKQTVSSSYKPAVLENGLKIQVPPFIESGDSIIVDTRTIEYIKKI